jgi:hypothetical protein
MTSSDTTTPIASARPWWLAPLPIGFGIVVLLACAAILLQDVVFPPKPIDPRQNVVEPGGATFCDTTPSLPEVPADPADTATHPAKR